LWNKGGHVPFHHQYILAQLIKRVIQRGDDAEFNSYVNYNFSGLKGQTQVSRKGLHFFSNKVTLVFSCGDADFLEYFLDNLFDLEEFELGNLRLSPEVVEKEEPLKFLDKMKYVCISPMVLRRPGENDLENKVFINPEEDLFSDLLYESTIERLELSDSFPKSKLDSIYRFQIIPDKAYLAKIKANGKKFARVYPTYIGEEKYEVRGYTFPFTLYADSDVQEFLFTQGIGCLCDKGFGMVDIANSDPVQRVITRKSKSFLPS
jgi:CRISPR-associated endoribonuclease Cas6